MDTDNWFVESISPTEFTTPPTKEEMEKLLPLSWPAGWEEIERHSGSGSLWIKIGHLSPDPYYAANEHINVHLLLLPDTKPGIIVSKYDFTADLRITYVKDSETGILDLSESKSHAEKELLKAKKLLQESGGELSEEERHSLEELMNQVSQFVSEVKEMKYLGEKARGISAPDGKTGVLSVSIGRFVLDRSLIGSEQYLKSGSTKIHSVKCYATGSHDHKPCSTLKAEGFIHREEVEQILRSIFSRIKGEIKEEVITNCAEIIRGQTKIENPKRKYPIKDGDIIKTAKTTQINIADNAGNKISIGGKTEVKMNAMRDLKLIAGTITAFIKKLKPKTKFEVHTPTSAVSVRGTAFSLFTDDNATTLTVIEGSVEFSDLKGNKVMVKDNQSCICSKEQGIQKPIILPVDLKEYKEV